MEVNSLAPKTLWFQGTLTERPLPERQLLPATVGGGTGAVVEPSLCDISMTVRRETGEE
jgi:hypothetical protein